MSGGDGDGGEVDTRRGEKEGIVEVPVPNLVPEDTGGVLGGEVGSEKTRQGKIRPEEGEEWLRKRLRDQKSKVEEWLMWEGVGSSE